MDGKLSAFQTKPLGVKEGTLAMGDTIQGWLSIEFHRMDKDYDLGHHKDQ